MQKVIGAVRLLVFVLVGLAVLYVGTVNYSFIFSRNVKGEILAIERVTQPAAVLSADPAAAQLFSFAIAVKEPSGEIVTSSSEDRQWAVAERAITQQHLCVEAKFYPYPPWDLEKAGTYYNARLIKLVECPAKADATTVAPHEQTQKAEPAK